MGFCRLSKILLSTIVLLAISASAGFAGNSDGTATVSIRAMATVVPPLGVTSPEDNRVMTSPLTSLGVRDINSRSQGAQALSLHRLLVRYPSVGSVIVSVQAESRTLDSFSLQQLTESENNDARSEPSGPGAVIIDLSEQFECVTDPDSDCVITLIYTEN